MGMSFKWLKYAVKEQILGTLPQAYWGARTFLRGPLEPEMSLLPDLCDSTKGVLDIGANWGAYSFQCARIAQHVHCFEPQPRLAQVLRKGVGRRANVTVHQCALSDNSGKAAIRIPRNDIGYSTIEKQNVLEGKVDLSRGIETVNVPTKRLDDLELGCISFMKIDVEGHELAVLNGGLNLLKEQKPTILVESENRHNPGVVQQLNELLEGLGYRSWVLEQHELQPFDPTHHVGRNILFRSA